MIIQKGRAGEAYNIGSGYEMTNIDLVHCVLDILQKPHSLITYAPDRPSHDYQYPLDSTKISEELGWKLEFPFDLGVRKTIDWYRKNQTWWENLKFVNYGKYYEKILAAKRRA
jgi:dTDP-glucose 4,6-dehydratase